MTDLDVVVVVITHPAEGAEALARTLVESRLAACAQVLPGVRSWYRWEGELEGADETRIELKTTRDRLLELQRAVCDLHPYQVPELLVLTASGGLDTYLDWVRQSTRPL